MSDPNASETMTSIAPPRESSSRVAAPLYGPFYGLTDPPFDLTPNPRFVFVAGAHREVLSNLRYALATSKGFTLILGEAGTGKTTLVRTALAGLADTPNRYALVSNPTLAREEFYEFLTHEFGLSDAASRSKTRFLAELQADVEGRFAAGGLTGLIVDEAQSMPHDLLEEIRLLGNIETSTTKLLNIVLCGQPELADRLNEQSLRQLKQRVALRCELRPLTLGETASYVSGRLRIAGGSPANIFTRDAVVAAYEGSRGIPRTVNVICDNALLNGYARQIKPVSVEVVKEVCRDFDLHPEAALADQPSPRLATPEPAAPAVTPGASTSLAPRSKRRFSFFS